MGRPIDHDSLRQQRLRGEFRSTGKSINELAREVVIRDFEFLQTVATLNGGSDSPASLSTIAKAYSRSKQAIHQRVNRLRARGWLEWGDTHSKVCGVRLTHNGKLLIETGLGAGLTE